MALANPFVLTFNSVDKSLVKINQDKYASEYLLKETDGEYRAFVRHSTEGVQPNGVQFDRHVVEIRHKIYGEDGAPDEEIIAYLVLRASKKSANTDVQYTALALADEFDSTLVGQLLGWQS